MRELQAEIRHIKTCYVAHRVNATSSFDMQHEFKRFDDAIERVRKVAAAEAYEYAAKGLEWYGAQGNLVHPDTAQAGVQACIKTLNNLATELRSEI